MARYVIVLMASGAAIQVMGDGDSLSPPNNENMLSMAAVGDGPFSGPSYDDFHDSNALAVLMFDLANHLDDGVGLEVKVKQQSPDLVMDEMLLELKFVDKSTGDQIYSVKGMLSADENQTNSIVSIMDAMDDFSEVELSFNPDLEEYIEDMRDADYFNEYNSLGRNTCYVAVPTAPMPNVPNVFDLLTNQDDEPTDLYMQFTDDFGLYTDMIRVANKLNIGLTVELDPTLTLDQVYMLAEDLAPMNHRVRLIWSPIRARPLGATGLKGKKIARHAGGFLMGQLLRRRANTNVQGIPPLHTPIAGHDFPITFAGIEQNPEIILDDLARKKLAKLQVNVVQRVRFSTGIRFVIGDCLTANGDNTSVLKLSNASDVSMFIDNRIKEIIKRHLLKAMETMIEDALKECVKFLEACTTKERKLLVKSEEFSGFYDLQIIPREDRPFDAVAVKCRYRPQGAARAAFLDTEVTK